MENKQRPIKITSLTISDVTQHKIDIDNHIEGVSYPKFKQMGERFKKTFGGK